MSLITLRGLFLNYCVYFNNTSLINDMAAGLPMSMLVKAAQLVVSLFLGSY